MKNVYDVVIIGSGLGGLECGVMLSKEGYNVCILEQSASYGGCLQSFTRKNKSIDTGIHYVGSMDDGQIMRQYLKYFGILDKLQTVRLDDDFDVINFNNEDQFSYKHGYDSFFSSLNELFPLEREGLKKYCAKIYEIGSSINTDVHKSGLLSSGGGENLSVSASMFINECVKNETLRNVLAGTNILYGGVRESANLYHHAMINHSNIEGAYRFLGGTQKIADLMMQEICDNGGTIRNNSKVIHIEPKGSEVVYVELENSEHIYGKYFISDLHPASTFGMLGVTPNIKKAYKTRLSSLANTYGLFSVYLVMKEKRFPYINKNLYFFNGRDVWDILPDNKELVPKVVMFIPQTQSADMKYSDVVTLISPVDNSLFGKWIGTSVGSRGEEYENIKEKITHNIINEALKRYPELSDGIGSIYSASPLTYLSYTGTPEGSAYGILKDYRKTLFTLFPVKTKLKNLYLTGQNLNVHGALGVTLTAAATCSELLGMEYLAKKIGGA